MTYSIHYTYTGNKEPFIEMIGDDLEEATDAFETVCLSGQSSTDEDAIFLMKDEETIDCHPWGDE